MATPMLCDALTRSFVPSAEGRGANICEYGRLIRKAGDSQLFYKRVNRSIHRDSNLVRCLDQKLRPV
jgi:hypothetical protein